MATTTSGNRRFQPGRATRTALLIVGFGLVAQLQPVAATARSAVPAATGPISISAASARLVANLAAAAQPAMAFGKLTARDRQAVVRFLSVASTRTQRLLVPSGSLHDAAAARSVGAAPGAGCWNWRWERDAYNLFGLKLWAYFQEIDWCDDGYTLIRDPQLLNYGSTYFPFWTWVHAGDHVWGGAGQPAFRSWTQADFSLCLAPNIGCIQNTYPWLDMTAHANGTGGGSVG